MRQSSQPLTMAGIGSPPALVPNICMYRAYFSSPETDLFSGDFEAVLGPYLIDLINTAAAQTLASVSHQIYAASHKKDPTAILLWNATHELTEDRNPGRVSLLHSLSHYASRIGYPASKWGDRMSANQEDVFYGTAPLAVWDPTYLHLAPSSTCLAPALYTPLFLETPTSPSWYHTARETWGRNYTLPQDCVCPRAIHGLIVGDIIFPVEAWNCLRGSIANAVAKAAFWPIIDWLRPAIFRSGPNTHSALVIPNPSAPLPNALLLHHRHRLLRPKHQLRGRNPHCQNGWRGGSGADRDAAREQAGPGQ